MDARTTDAPATALASSRKALIDAFVSAGWSRQQAEGAVDKLGDPIVVSQYRVAANENLAGIKAPVLALYAGNDTVVSTPHSLLEAKRALKNNPDATIIEVPHMNHVFQRLEMGASGKPENVGPPISDPGTLDLVEHWLTAHLRPAVPSHIAFSRSWMPTNANPIELSAMP